MEQRMRRYRGPSIKYVPLFLAIFYPPPLCHTLSHIPGPPSKVCQPSRTLPPPHFLFARLQKIRTKAPCTNSLSIARGVLSGEFVRGSFVWKALSGMDFVHSSFCHNTSVTRES